MPLLGLALLGACADTAEPDRDFAEESGASEQGTLRGGSATLERSAEHARARFDALGDLPGGYVGSRANDVSAAGDVVVGSSYGPDGEQPVRWTVESGLVSVGSPTVGAESVSPNGRILAGWQARSPQPGSFAVRWVPGQPYEVLKGWTLTPRGVEEMFLFTAEAVRDDGRVYGACAPNGDYGNPVACVFLGHGLVSSLWRGSILAADAAGNFAGLRYLRTDSNWRSVATYNHQMLPYPDGISCPRTGCRAEARDFSRNGLVVGGATLPSADGESALDAAFTYSQEHGSRSLPDIPGGNRSSLANAVSADGRVIAGWGVDDAGQEAVVWLEREAHLLSDLLRAAGVELPEGYRMWEVSAMSADGHTFVGNGFNGQGVLEAFRVALPSVP